jgi:hypothetical protein
MKIIQVGCLVSIVVTSIILMLKGLGGGIWIGGDRLDDFPIEDVRKETKDKTTDAETHDSNYFSEENGMVKNSKTKQAFKPSGREICEYRASLSEKLLYVYSFSGYRRHPVGYAFLPDMRVRGAKIGIHYVEIFNLETEQRIFFNKTLSFSDLYKPKSVF